MLFFQHKHEMLSKCLIFTQKWGIWAKINVAKFNKMKEILHFCSKCNLPFFQKIFHFWLQIFHFSKEIYNFCSKTAKNTPKWAKMSDIWAFLSDFQSFPADPWIILADPWLIWDFSRVYKRFIFNRTHTAAIFIIGA